jgi:transcriptional regulator with XRE-family HTH domain
MRRSAAAFSRLQDSTVSGDVYDQIGTRIRQLRTERGLTQAELAERVGVSVESLSRAERGVILPTVRTLGGIAAALGADLSGLIQGGLVPATHESVSVYESAEARRLKRLVDELDPRSIARLLGIALLLPRRKESRR